MKTAMNSNNSSKILVVGFDEAGRGPLAGPVCAGAVILPDDFPIELLNDSKKLSEKKRLIAEEIIKEKPSGVLVWLIIKKSMKLIF